MKLIKSIFGWIAVSCSDAIGCVNKKRQNRKKLVMLIRSVEMFAFEFFFLRTILFCQDDDICGSTQSCEASSFSHSFLCYWQMPPECLRKLPQAHSYARDDLIFFSSVSRWIFIKIIISTWKCVKCLLLLLIATGFFSKSNVNKCRLRWRKGKDVIWWHEKHFGEKKISFYVNKDLFSWDESY